MGGKWTQLFPPAPTLTEANLRSQTGKVFIVTGGNNGIGFELAKILYGKGGTVYITGRSLQKVSTAIARIEEEYQDHAGKGHLKSLVFDLADLMTIAGAIDMFTRQETRLDVLFNNAGIAQVAPGSVSAQGHEAHMGTNCLGPFLFTKLLTPILIKTAEAAPEGSVRVVFASSSIVEMAPPGGLDLAELQQGKHSKDKARNYAASKVGNWFLAAQCDKRLREHGIICLTQNPGNLKTDSWNNVPVLKTLFSPLMQEAIFGAYTNLWCGFSEDVTVSDGGRYAIPWGRWHPNPRGDIVESLRDKAEGGTGVAAEFEEWCEKETAPYVR